MGLRVSAQFGWSATVCSIMTAGRNIGKNAHVSFRELGAQNKWDEELLGAHTRDNLSGSLTDLRPVWSVSVSGAHQVNSWLFIPFSEREEGPIQTIFTSARTDGLNSLGYSTGVVANERVSTLDGSAALVSKMEPQPQSDSITTLHAHSPSLEGSCVSRVRDSDGGQFLWERWLQWTRHSGWGAVCEGRIPKERWPISLQKAHRNFLELLTVFLAVLCSS